MLPTHFKEDVRELIALAKECPDSLQEKCLQILLDDYLNKPPSESRRVSRPPPAADPEAPIAADPEEGTEESIPDSASPSGQRDLIASDLHLRAKKFLQQYSLSLADINQLFFIEDAEIKPLYDDLKTMRASETQVRIGLLQALRAGIRDGEFQFSGEEVRTECQDRKAYDKTNFAANFKNSASLFAGFEKYDKNAPMLKLTDLGKQRLADAIKELK